MTQRSPWAMGLGASALAAVAMLAVACGGNAFDSGDGSGGSGGAGGSGGSGGSGGGCEWNGKKYPPNTSVPSGDDCNSCFCGEDGTVACTGAYCPEGCDYQGTFYEVGETFEAGDGCNSCTCMEGGEVACTLAACSGCQYGGEYYAEGETFSSLDGCNTCTCEGGGVSCTELPCMCDPQKEWWRNYVSTDPGECAVIDFGCPDNTRGFENQCGCGCEQDESCPEYFDCMPPSPCDVAQIERDCPFSKIAY